MSKDKASQNRPPMHTEPLAVRRKLAAQYAKMAEDTHHTKAERADFARIAERWRATLDEK